MFPIDKHLTINSHTQITYKLRKWPLTQYIENIFVRAFFATKGLLSQKIIHYGTHPSFKAMAVVCMAEIHR